MNKIFKDYNNILVKPVFIILLALLFNYASGQQQQILLVADTIPLGDPNFVFDAPIFGNFGGNDWVINTTYNGLPGYPNTPNEDSVLGGLGQIHGAPYSSYLHIHDTASVSGQDDANWNPANHSDRFCYMSNSYCTLGLLDVSFTFFWTGQGDTTAYGQVYFSANGGPWTQTGQAKYNNQDHWKYEAIQDPRFNGLQTLQFGFRWVNKGGDTTKDVSWGIDDIIAVGQFSRDSFTFGGNFHIDSVDPTPICQDGNLNITFTLNPPLCDGNYIVYLSDSNGNFAHATTMQYSYDIGPFGASWVITEPIPNTLEGNCFRIYIQREDPPLINSDTSICFQILHCPVNIVTNNAPVLTDADTACVKSAIDIYFNSFGNFDNSNIYFAQLSDSTGSFAHPDTIGRLPSSKAFPAMPGDVSGLIPASVPPGCGYYVRIVSSSPSSLGTVIGPFCITQCDVTTNNTIDLHVCINYPTLIDTVRFNINDNQWNQGASYDTCNNWTVELLDMQSFGVVNVGGLGIYHDSLSGTFTMIVGPLATLPVAPGTYYMRIISNCSNESWNETGTVIRITIGAPSAVPLTIIGINGDSVLCNDQSMGIELDPNEYNPNSSYTFTSNLFNAFSFPVGTFPALNVNLAGVPASDWVVYVQESNYGCLGPLGSYSFVTTTKPIVEIYGPKKVCLGDTAIFNASYLPATYYNWTAPPGVRVYIQSNTQVSMIFDSLGHFTISENSVNVCGDTTGTLGIDVFSLFQPDLGPNKMDCIGDSITLNPNVPPYPREFDVLDSSLLGNQGGMFNLYAHNDIIIDSFAVTFRTRAINAKTAIYSKPGSYRGYEQLSASWNLLATNTIPLAAPVLTKTVIPAELNKTVAAGDTAAFYITTTNTNPVFDLEYGNGIGVQQGIVYKSDGVIDLIQGCENTYPFGAHLAPKVLDVTIYYRTKAGIKYLWNTGDTTSTITLLPTQSNEYEVKVYDTLGCRASDSVFVKVDTLPHVYAGPDTSLCPNVTYIIPAIASPTAAVSWNPTTGLNQPDSLHPVFNGNQTTAYIVTATNPDGCKSYDSVVIGVYPLSVNAGPDTSICETETYVMVGTASTDSIEWTPSVGLSAVNILNPTFNYNQTTKYYLIVKDSAGCTISDSVTISVVYCNSYIKVPQAFTPNGDGTNDHFTVYGEYIADYQIKIFNRWGEEVYSSTDVNDLNNLGRGWDGTYKGKLQDVGTFVYYITAKDINGKNIFKKGNLTLIR